MTNNLYNALHKPNDHVLGVFRGEEMTGLFDFLILEDERYIEMIVGLSREAAAYGEIAGWLRANYPGFHADFVFNPANALLGELLRSLGAEFYTEQQKMVYSGPVPHLDTTGIEGGLSKRCAVEEVRRGSSVSLELPVDCQGEASDCLVVVAVTHFGVSCESPH